jgi:mRNA interferase MazF
VTSFSSRSGPPARGDVWFADLDPTRGHEQAGRRPVLVVSGDRLNRGTSGLIVMLPITSRLRDIPSHVRLLPPDGGLARESVVMCEQIRSIAVERLLRPLGTLSATTLASVEGELRKLLGL